MSGNRVTASSRWTSPPSAATSPPKGERYPGGPRLLAAKLVGRWPDGTALAVSPDRPDAKLSSDPARINDFGYTGDPDKLRCLLGAHIRRTNPR